MFYKIDPNIKIISFQKLKKIFLIDRESLWIKHLTSKFQPVEKREMKGKEKSDLNNSEWFIKIFPP
jgi:hypothetical protein